MKKNKTSATLGTKGNDSEENIIIYTDEKGNTELRADVEKETIWATQAQIAHLFGVNSQGITKHLKNIFNEGELSRDSTCSKMEQVQIESGRAIKRSINIYNLDAIIAVGYRVNSKKATRFRIWATKILREYVVNWFNSNGQLITKSSEKLEGLEEAISLIESTRNSGKLKGKITIKLTKNLEAK